MSVIIRLARPEDTRAACEVRVASWRESYQGMVPQQMLDDLDVERDVARSSLPPPKGVHRFVAELDGKIVGIGVCGPRRVENAAAVNGEVYAIYLLGEAKGKGLGCMLMQRMAEQLVADGMTDLTVNVLTANTAARKFYERLGGICHGVGLIDRGMDEVVYVWDDIRKLLPKKSQQPNKPKGP